MDAKMEMAVREAALVDYAAKVVKDHWTARNKFIEELKADFEHAMEWSAEGVLKGAFEAKVFARLSEALTSKKTDGPRMLVFLQDQVNRLASLAGSSKSSHPFHELDREMEMKSYTTAMDILKGVR